jgi:hypothetical protein
MFPAESSRVILLCAATAFLCACQENKTETLPENLGSFDLIQSKILTPTCAITGCHAAESDVTFIEHGLILEKSVSYQNLVNILPKNQNALTDGLLRVKPSEPEESLFLHKLHIEDHHSSDYGNPMPLGLEKLSEGQVEFIEQWIAAGAPLAGNVADATLLDDKTGQDESFEPLAVPEAGKGFRVNIDKFSVAPNFEREFFVYKPVGNTTDIFVNRFELKMRNNSHHLVIYDFDPAMTPMLIPVPNVDRDIRNPDNTLNIVNMLPMPYHIFIFGAQSPYVNYEFPAGIAFRVKAHANLDFNSHYVNRGSQSISGEVNVNFHTIPENEVVKEAKSLNMGNNSISINPGERKTIQKTFTVANGISVVGLTSHTHELGEKFVIRIVGGVRNNEIVYSSLDWHHPQFVTYDPPIQLQAGEGLMSEITYHNTRSVLVKFGLTSQDEMGIIFGYYTDN